MKIPIGRAKDTSQVMLDVMTLISTGIVVVANSGGGKSGALRLIAERAGESMQVIILDNEGEFATLREKLDVLLVGPEGELPADPRRAAELARRLLETQVSTVIDMSEMPLEDEDGSEVTRRMFVRKFLTALIDLPKYLWRPTLVILDEAHLYCPQGERVASSSAVIALQSLGRKRGYRGILATQRLSKLHKDAAADANNLLIGRTFMDVDVKRANSILGFGKEKADALMKLPPQCFYAFGPAFSRDGVFSLRVDNVSTSMPKAGQYLDLLVPPPSSKVAALLSSEFRDMPADAVPTSDLATGSPDVSALHWEIAQLRERLAREVDPERHREMARFRGDVESARADVIYHLDAAAAGIYDDDAMSHVNRAYARIVKLRHSEGETA